MKLVKIKKEDSRQKIFFADEDGWGYVRYGIIFQTDHDLNVMALELYSSKSGIAFWDCVGHKHVFNPWESDDVMQGTFGISKAFTVKFSRQEQLIGDETHFYNILDDIKKGLSDNYIARALNDIVLYKKRFKLDLSHYESSEEEEAVYEDAGIGTKLKSLFKGR